MTRPLIRSFQRRLGTGASALLLTALAACASAPEVRFHSLLASERAAPQPAGPTAPRVVVAPVAVPPALDQPQWLVRRPDDSLQRLEQDRWASPLADELRAAVRDALVGRWGVNDAYTAALPVAPAGVPSAWRIQVELLRLDARPGRDTLLEARWTVLPPQRDAVAASCRSLSRETVSADGILPLVAAHRAAVARLADDIGRQLKAMAAGAGPTCVAAPVS